MDPDVGVEFLNNDSELNDGLTKCGEICVSFSSYDIVFVCLFCNNQKKYLKFDDFADHMRAEHLNYEVENQPKPLNPIDVFVTETVQDVGYEEQQSDVLADVDIVYAYLDGSETANTSDCPTPITQNTDLYSNVEILMSNGDDINNANSQCPDNNSDCQTVITQNTDLYSNVELLIPSGHNIHNPNIQCADKNSDCSTAVTQNTDLYSNLDILMPNGDNMNNANIQCTDKNSNCTTNVEILMSNEDNANDANNQSTDKCMIEVLDIYRKCIGLWHIKTAENTSLNVKAEAFRLLHTTYSSYYKDSTLNDLENRLSNMTDLVNAEIDNGYRRNDGQSKLWYFNNLSFLRYANDEQIPDEEFADFNCRTCEDTVAEFTSSADLWTHIITKHLEITKKFRLRAAYKEKTFPLKWPEENILQFIELYREQECLWNLKSTAYHNHSLKTNAYMVIVEKFEEICPNVIKDRTSVKVAIRHLRDYFGRVDKKCKNASSPETTLWYSKSNIYQKLLFLRDVYLPRRTPPVKVYACELCAKSFKKRKDFLAHTKIKHADAIYRCDKCPLIFRTQYQIETHRKEHLNKPDTPDGNKYTCPICQVNCKSSEDLATHLNKHLPKKSHRHMCEICGAKFDDRSNLLIHIRRHTNTKNFTCNVCNKGFVTSTELKSHVVVHTNEKPFVCEICGLKFKFQNRLGNHRLFHGEPKFECSQCDMKFITNRHLIDHQRSHGPVPKVGCDICDRLFRNLDSLLRHKRKIHNIKRREQPKVVYSEADFSESIFK